MSTISADECYSNIENVEELRRICSDRDAIINKLKVLLVRKNKALSTLESEISKLNGGVPKSYNLNDSSEVVRTDSLLGRQQSDLNQRKREVEMLSKMNSDLQKSIFSIKQERDAFKAEVSRLTCDLVTSKEQFLELYSAASKVSQLPSNVVHATSHSKYLFILSTLKKSSELVSGSPLQEELISALLDIQQEISHLLGIKMAPIDKQESLLSILSGLITSLKMYPSAQNNDSLILKKKKLASCFADLSRDHMALKSIVRNFSVTFDLTARSLAYSVKKLASTKRLVKPDHLLNDFFLLREELSEMQELVARNSSSFATESSALEKHLHSVLSAKCLNRIPDEVTRVELSDSKLKTVLSLVPNLQQDMTEVKSSALGLVTVLQAQIEDIQHLSEKLMAKVNQQRPSAPPPYSDYPETPNTTRLESLLTDIWQLKDCLSGMKYVFVEECSRYQKQLKEISCLRHSLLQKLQSQVVEVRCKNSALRKEMADLMSSYSIQFTTLSTLVRSLEDSKSSSIKESEITKLGKSCDSLSEDSSNLRRLREALCKLVEGSNVVPEGHLTPSDANLISHLVEGLKQSQETRMGLSELASKSSALQEAQSLVTQAESRTIELEAEVSHLKEKFAGAKQLLLKARKEVSEAKERTVLAQQETESRVNDLTAERDRLAERLSALQKQFESYKVKAVHALRNGKKSETDANNLTSLSPAETSLTWRYEYSSLVQSEMASLKESVKELEASLQQTRSRLNAVSVDLESANYALAAEKEQSASLAQTLNKERARWREEREAQDARNQAAITSRMSELESALEAAEERRSQDLAAQAEELTMTFRVKLSDLEAKLEAAEAKIDVQRKELADQSEIIANSLFPPQIPRPETTLSSHCGRGVGIPAGNSTPSSSLCTRPLEEALFGDDESGMAETRRENDRLQELVHSLRTQLANESRNLEYTKSLLADSEATVERLSAQATILKSEIRRYELNAERDRHLGGLPSETASEAAQDGSAPPLGVETRTEYLKNILLRFLGSSVAASERMALVPVLATLLALSSSERSALSRVAETGVLAQEGGQGGGEGASGWTSYLPSIPWFGGDA